MVNILVADNNIYYIKSLINSISEKNIYIRISAIETNGTEVLEKIKKNEIDIILLDIQMPYYNGLTILDILSTQYINDYKNSVIVMSNHCDLFQTISNNPCVYSYVNKINGIDCILDEIEVLVKIKEMDKAKINLKNIVIEELRKINYNFSYSGTKYLIESILLIIKNKDIDNINLKKDIYPIIAEKNNKTVTSIKMNINNANEMMFYDCNQEKLDNYFGYKVTSKPKTKFVISTILQKIYININK